MRCESCGLEAPTANVKLYQNIGMLVLHRYRSVKGNMCKPCIDNYFWQYTLATSVLGWWGLISLFLTPLFIVNNLFQFIKSRSLSTTVLGLASLPMYVASPSAQPQCPHCQSYQTKAVPLSGTVLASVGGGGLFLLWGLSLGLRFLLGRTSAGNLVFGLFFIGIAAFAALSLWMVVNYRMWRCQQCNRAWVPRRT
jgi:hypothetical protein